MVTEVVVTLAWLAAGSALGWRCGVRGPAVPAVGFVVGVALHVGWTGILVVAGLPTGASVAVPATVLTAAVVLLVGVRGRSRRWPRGRSVLATVAGTVALVAASWASGVVQVTPDTFRYLTTTGLLRSGQLEQAMAFTLESRLLAVSAMHTPASAQALYLRSVTPLLAVGCLVTLAWLVRRGTHTAVSGPTATTITALAVLLLATNNRFLWHAFYVNGHLALAAWLLVVGGTAWLVVGGRVGPSDWFVPLQVAVLPAIVLTRPEAALVAALVLAPLWVSRHVPTRHRYPSALALGVTLVAWNAYLWNAYRADGAPAPTSVLAMLAVGAALVVAAAVIARADHLLPRRSLGLAEVGLWVLLVALAVANPGILYRSAMATLSNVVLRGGWGTSLLVVATLVVAVLVATPRSPARTALRFPLTTFVPFGMLLAYLREDAFRVGPGDSLNRMLLHLLPLAVLLVVATSLDVRDRDHTAEAPARDGRTV